MIQHERPGSARGMRGPRRQAALLRRRPIPVTLQTLAETVQKQGLTKFYPELMEANARLAAR